MNTGRARADGWRAGTKAPAVWGAIAVIGAPASKGSITPGHCHDGPDAIRKALQCYSPYDVQYDSDLSRVRARDLGNLEIAFLRPEKALETLRRAVARALGEARAVALLGGDNSITYPSLLGMADACAGGNLKKCGLLTLDAHFDLRDTSGGLSNGNPVRALLEAGLPGGNIVQIGVQAFANSQYYGTLAREAGISVISADQVHVRGIDSVMRRALDELGGRTDVMYVNFDVDVLDRTFAPGSPGSRPGGISPWELRIAARECGLNPKVQAIDIVEFDPEKDASGATALTAASLLLSFVSGLHDRLKAVHA